MTGYERLGGGGKRVREREGGREGDVLFKSSADSRFGNACGEGESSCGGVGVMRVCVRECVV